MTDLISRQAAIDALDMIGSVDTDADREYAREVFMSLPSAQQEQPSEIQDILDYLDTALHPIISPEHWNVYSELHDMISTLPSAQPEIIYCKDCTRYEKKNGRCNLVEGLNVATANSFCSYGERKE